MANDASVVGGGKPGEPATVPVVSRRRIPIATTVHRSTIDRMARLCARFGTSQGRLIDKMCETLDRAYEGGKMLCVSGSACPMNRTDLPEVF